MKRQSWEYVSLQLFLIRKFLDKLEISFLDFLTHMKWSLQSTLDAGLRLYIYWKDNKIQPNTNYLQAWVQQIE